MLVLFAVLPPRRAVITAFLAGFLFLPMVSYDLPYLPDYTKMSATCGGILMGALLFDSKRVLSFRMRFVDMPVIVLCLVPFVSSWLNGLGIWDGASAVLNNTVTWGFPYLIGRIYFRNLDDLKELAVGIFIGGLVYIPLCLFEMRMSPQLAGFVYGSPGRWYNAARFWGWRPRVFMEDGLQLGMWMAISSLVGFWLWWTGSVKQIAGFRASWLAWLLVFVAILCRSTGALALGLAGVGALLVTRTFGTKVALIVLLLAAPAYILFRTTGLWHGEPIQTISNWIDPDRTASFQFRIDNEDILTKKALQEPVFGWGGWGRSRVYDKWGTDISITDGFWVIELGTHGLVGLLSWLALMILPLGLLLRRYSARELASTAMAPAILLALTVVLFAIDCLVNAMITPVFILACGAVVGTLSGQKLAFEQRGAVVSKVEAAAPLRRLYPGSR